MNGEIASSLVGPALTLLTALLVAVAKWLWDLRAAASRIEASQKRTSEQVEKLAGEVGELRERTAGLEGAVFKRPPILKEDL